MANDKKTVDAFGHMITEARNCIAVKGGEGMLDRYGVELDKETGNTKPVVVDTVDMKALINSYKDQCGMEYMLRLVQAGKLSLDRLADDGTGSGDFTGPDNLNDAYRAAQAAKVQGDKVAASLGIQDYMNAKDLDALVAQKVAELMEAQKASVETKGEEK